MDVEIPSLALKYASLRVLDPGRVARLVAALSREEQHTPVLVVGEGVLVDGYHRVAALRKLGRDLVKAVRLDVSETEALVLAWRLETGRRKNALEEGWLLVELIGAHGRSQAELASELPRGRSWVSQRLGLVRALPDDVQDAIRQARVPAQAAMKSLLPMARMDRAACSRIVAATTEPLTVRQWGRLVGAWRKAEPETRRRAQRREAQLGRLPAGAEPAQPWLVRLVRARLDVAGESRFRLRRWGAGGTPDGSCSFVVSRPASGASAAPSEPARGDDLAARLAALEADAATSRARVARLEARLAAAERLIARMEPVVAASEQALLILGGVDDADP